MKKKTDMLITNEPFCLACGNLISEHTVHVGNVFCPTGKGGGVDPTCGSGSLSSSDISSLVSHEFTDKDMKANQKELLPQFKKDNKANLAWIKERDKATDKFLDNMTNPDPDIMQKTHQALAIKKYASINGYEDMNKTMEKTNNKPSTDHKGPPYKFYQDAIAQPTEFKCSTLQKAIEDAPPLKNNTTVYRGMKIDSVDFKAGQEISSKGFTSTTASPLLAAGYGNVICSIDLPAGQKCLALNNKSLELTLPAGLKFDVAEATKMKVRGKDGWYLKLSIKE